MRFLTIVPVPGREAAGPGALGQAAWWFPVVGLGLGAALVALNGALVWALPPMLSAVVVLTAWKVLTGGLHLDGLADCLDGLGGADAAHRLAIMRDSRIGTFGGGGLVLCLLVASSALADMAPRERAPALLIAPVLGRIAPLIAGTRYRSATPESGMASGFFAGLPRWAGPVYAALTLAVAAAVLGPVWIVVGVVAMGAGLAWCAFFTRRLGGVTGDVLGGAVELTEVSALVLGASSLVRSLPG